MQILRHVCAADSALAAAHGPHDRRARRFAHVETTLIVLIAAAFLALLGLNVYFRARVLRAYRELHRAGVDFDARDMLTQPRIEEIVARYPAHEDAIRRFTGGIRRSMSIASALIVLITALGATLMWYR